MFVFEFTEKEIQQWSSATQAVSKLADKHFSLFAAMESGKVKRKPTMKALGTLERAAAYIRASCSPSECAYRTMPSAGGAA